MGDVKRSFSAIVAAAKSSRCYAENILLLDQEYGFRQGSREVLLTLENLAKIYRTSVPQLA